MGDDNVPNWFKHPDMVVHTKPKLKDLRHWIVPRYAAKWKVLGTLLGLPSGILSVIEHDNWLRCERCCAYMFEEWLREGRYNATWRDLFTALESPAMSDEDISLQLRVSPEDNGGLKQFMHPDKANSTPLLEDLKQHFVPRYATEWKIIGILLELNAQELDVIEINYPDSCVKACMAMLMIWLKTDTPSWTKLLKSIESPAISSTSDKMTLALDQLKDKGMSGTLRPLNMDNGGLEQFKDADKVNTKPLLKDLYEQITPQYAADWKVIGKLLGVTSGKLDVIEADCPNRIKDRCNKMLKIWLEIDPVASWRKLFAAIESSALSHSKLSNIEMFKKLYYQAKHNLGTEELQLYKLVIFGPPGVGKSSLFQVLLGNDPNPVRSSTGVLDKKLVQVFKHKIGIATLADHSKSSWHPVSIKTEISRLRSTIEKAVERLKQVVEVTLPAAVDVGSNSTVNVASHPTITVASNLNRSETKLEAELFKPPTEVPTQNASIIMACYDSGGQPEFFDVMPALMTIPTGNIMVFDLSKDIHSKIESEFYEEGKSSGLQHQAHYTTAELLSTAIANIQSYSNYDATASGESNTNRLLVVGTHLDKCGQTDDEKFQEVNEIETMIWDKVLAEEVDQMFYRDSDDRIIHPISNTDYEGRDEAAQKIRTAIEHMSKYQKSYSEVPINWLLFQLEVQLTDKNYIERSECIKIAKRCSIRENDLDYVLMYFHQLGILLHYGKVSGLEDVIFCKPQWLFDQLTEVIKFKYKPAVVIQRDISKGIFHKGWLRSCSKELDKEGKLKCDNLLQLFTHLKIMSVLPNKPDQYFMPALLNPAPTDKPLQEEYGVQVHDAMLVKFKHRHFPRGMFCCLVTHLAQNGWFIQVKHAYKNLIVFQIIPDHYVVLFDKINHVAVEIHCEKERCLQGIHYDVCDKLYRNLQKVCEIFQTNCDFEFGFICKDTKCQRFAGVKLQYTITTNFCCKECPKDYELNCDQLVWFMPPHILKAQVSSLQQPGYLTDKDTAGPSQKQQKTEPSDKLSSTAAERYYNKKPDMCDLITIVIPKIQAKWEIVAYFLRYDVAAVDAFKKDGHDSHQCCIKVFEDWLMSSRGVRPKTWSKLLERIKAIASLKAASEEIETELQSLFKQ